MDPSDSTHGATGRNESGQGKVDMDRGTHYHYYQHGYDAQGHPSWDRTSSEVASQGYSPVHHSPSRQMAYPPNYHGGYHGGMQSAYPPAALAAIHPALAALPPAALAALQPLVAALPPAALASLPPSTLAAIHPALIAVPPEVLAAIPPAALGAIPPAMRQGARSMQHYDPYGDMRVTGRGVYLDPEMVHDIAMAVAHKLAQDGRLDGRSMQHGDDFGYGRNNRMEIVFVPN